MIIISVTVIFECLLDIRISQVQTISPYSVLPVPRRGCAKKKKEEEKAEVKLCSQRAKYFSLLQRTKI